MLAFFQKHEKITLSFVVVIVLLFFGSSFFYGQSDYNRQRGGKQEYATGIDGSTISRRELAVMKAFLSADSSDVLDMNQANIFNPGFLQHHFILSGMAQTVFDQAPSFVQDSFAQQMESHRQFRPYKHPENPIVSAELIWSIKAPKIGMLLKKITSSEELPINEQFATLTELYRAQHEFPPRFLAQYLTHLEQQQGMRRDPRLASDRLNLFGANDVAQWFGDGVLEQLCLFIHNLGLVAEQEGHLLSLEEVKQDLMNEGLRFIKERHQRGEGYDVQAHWNRVLNQLGLREKEVLECHRKVLLARRKLAGEGSAVLVSPTLLEDFEKAACQRVVLEQVEVAHPFQFGSLKELLSYALYCDTVYEKAPIFGCPENRVNLHHLAEKFPKFLETTFEVEMSVVNFDQLMTRIPLKEIKTAMLEDEYYTQLVDAFSFVSKEAKIPAERFNAIDVLPHFQQQQVYEWVKKQLFTHSFDTLIAGLDQKRSQVKRLSFTGGELVTPLKGIDPNSGQFFTFLEGLLYDDKNVAIDKYLEGSNIYTEDEIHYYQIVDCKKVADQDLMSFERIKELRVITTLLEEQTKAFYEQEKRKRVAAYKDEQGDWLSFTKAENDLYLASWRPLLSKLKQGARYRVDEQALETIEPSQYSKIAFIPLMEQAHQAYGQEGEMPGHVLVKKEKTVERHEASGEVALMLQMEEGEVSELSTNLQAFPSFFSVKSAQEGELDLSARLEKSQQLFKQSAQKAFVEAFTSELVSKEAFITKREG